MASSKGDLVTEWPKDFYRLKPIKPGPRKYEIIQTYLFLCCYGHFAALNGLYLCFTSAKWATIIFGYILFEMCVIGIMAGAHRLWSHKSYKAKLPLQTILMIFCSLAYQFTIYQWVRDHRLHHKCSDTDGDPYNASRGFFFSHIGWLLVKRHPEVKRQGQKIDMTDIHNNPVLMFQKKYVVPWIALICFILPTVIPMYFWGETFRNAWHINLLRYVLNLHVPFLVNSVAHMWGYKPYDKSIGPTQNVYVTLTALGEGFHNYHHTFPWDYRSAELGNNKLNFVTHFIDFFAWIGWAYDMKTASDYVVKNRAKRTGDGTDLWGKVREHSDEIITR